MVVTPATEAKMCARADFFCLLACARKIALCWLSPNRIAARLTESVAKCDLVSVEANATGGFFKGEPIFFFFFFFFFFFAD